MFTTELTIILPIVLLLLMAVLCLGFFLSDFILSTLSVEKDFLLGFMKEVIHNQRTYQGIIPVDVQDFGLFVKREIAVNRFKSNPFNHLINLDGLEYRISFNRSTYRRLGLRLVLEGGEMIIESK